MKTLRDKKLKQALIKDFKNLYQKEYTSAWRESRMIRSIEIELMSLKNTEKLIFTERQRVIEEVITKIQDLGWIGGLQREELEKELKQLNKLKEL